MLAYTLQTRGYSRDVFHDETHYNAILTIIIEYLKKAFVNFFDANIDQNYQQNMKVGDIAKQSLTKESGDFMVMGIDNELIKAGVYDLDDNMEHILNIFIDIPLSICAYLTDASSFYSKLNEIDCFKNANYYESILCMSYDDKWIIDNFGGALKEQYPSIEKSTSNWKHRFSIH